PQYYPD
ncbi:hypothetical protein EC960109_3697B, partial [Escherichia coli 96.0109]